MPTLEKPRREEVSLCSPGDDKIVSSSSGESLQRFSQTSSAGGGKMSVPSKNKQRGRVSGSTLVLVLTLLSLPSGCVAGRS